MRYLPHTDVEVQQMLERIGVAELDELFSGIPLSCRLQRPLDLPPAKSEAEAMSLLLSRGEPHSDGLVGAAS